MTMWGIEYLCQHNLYIALKEKSKNVNDKKWVKINHQACSSIHLCLIKPKKKLLCNEGNIYKNLWKTLEGKYMKFRKLTLFEGKTFFLRMSTEYMFMNDHIHVFNKIIKETTFNLKTNP